MLADLHELVGHFEEQHVTVVSPTGMPLWCGSPSSAGASGSSSGSASPASPYAQSHPFPTLTSAFTPVMTSGSRDPGAYLAQNCLAKEEERVFDTMLHSEAYDAPASVVPQYTIRDTANYRTAHDTTHDISSNVPANPPATHVHLPTIAPTPIHARPPTLSIITDTERRGRTWGEKRKKKRGEGKHQCPHEGCIKASGLFLSLCCATC